MSLQIVPVDLLIALAKIAIVLAVGLISVLILRTQSAALRHRVLAYAIAGSLAIPVLALLLPGWHGSVFTTVVPPPQTIHHTIAQQDTGILSSMLVQAEDRFPIYEWAIALWAAGALCFFVRLFVGLALRVRGHAPIFEESWVRQALQLSPDFHVTQPVRLLLSKRPDAMPVTWGATYPRILLPADALSWPTERRRIVLSHELAHIGRRDWAWQILAESAAAIFWFLPLSWIAAASLRRESERAADDAVLSSGVKPSFYAGELLDLSRTLTDTGQLCHSALAMARTSHLERRFINMLNTTTNRRRLSRTAAFVTTIAALAVMIPLATLRLPAQERSGKFTGVVTDPRSAVIPNATVIMSNAAAGTKDMTTSDAAGKFAFNGLAAGKYQMQILMPGFQAYSEPDVVLQPGVDAKRDTSLILGTVNERIEVNGGNNLNPPQPDGSAPKRIRVGGNVQAANLLQQVKPPYPPAAKAARIQGSILLQATISEQGTLDSLQVLSSQADPDLARAAVEAVQQWRYKPTLLNGEPVAVITNITVNFTLQQ
jgi:TonB family protein